MSQVTSFSWVPLKADAEQSEAGQALKSRMGSMLSQAGLEHAYHGKPMEHPGSVEMVSVWASEAEYNASRASPEAAEAAKLFADIVDTSDPKHKAYQNAVKFDKPFDSIASAPIVELSAIFLPTDVDTAAFEEAVAAFGKAMQEHGGAEESGYLGHSQGWALEEAKGHPKMPVAKVFVTAVGRTSLEKSKEAVEKAHKHAEVVRKFSEVYEVHHTTFEKAK